MSTLPNLVSISRLSILSLLISVASTLPTVAQGKKKPFPIDLIPAAFRSQVQALVEQSDFQFQTSTTPKKVKVASMEMLFEHPRLSAAMWRHCQFAPSFFAFEEDSKTFFIDDTKGLTGRLTLLYSTPGHRIYWVQGRAEAGRLKPFAPAVSAQMITSYRYWETEKGFETQLDTWTKLDNALLGFLAQPFRRYLQGRQDEFITYINSNIALFGESTELNSTEFKKSELILFDTKARKKLDELYRYKE
jgi:hypothetical protein